MTDLTEERSYSSKRKGLLTRAEMIGGTYSRLAQKEHN